MKRLLTALMLLLGMTPGLSFAATLPRVVVSLKPIHSLTSAIMAGVAEPELLVKGAASPHGYVLRPSEARALNQANLVIWVGPGLEGFLEKPLTTLGREADQLELARALKDKLLPARSGGSWESHTHHNEDDQHEPAEHLDHHETEEEPLAHFDHHLWLSPNLAKEIVTLTTQQLVSIDPDHQDIYQRNSIALLDRLDQLDARLKQQLQPVRDVPYLVFHAAYQYFEVAYSLRPIGSVTIDPEHRPGVKRVKEIRETIRQSGAKCVFSEPQFESRLIKTLVEGTAVKTAVLDPLGADLPAGQESYFTLMENMGKNLYRGLTD